MVDTQKVFNLNQIQRTKYSFLGDNEKLLIKPYFEEKDNQSLSIMLDPQFQKDIEQQIKIKSCLTSQVIFYIQVYLDLVYQKLEENKSKTINDFFQDFKIGIIGCGVIGKSVLNALVFLLGWVEPNNIHISTRRPENLSKYEDIGFNIYFDNEKLIEQCDIIIICFPPSLDNWAIVELKDAIIQRQQNSNKLFQPFFISVVSNMYINKIQKLLLIERIFARTHIVLFIDNKFSEIIKINNQQQQEAKDQLDSELNFGMQLFEDKQLIQQILIAFSFIFYGTKIKEEEFKLSDIQKNIQEAFLGQIYNQIDDNDLVDVASKKYEQRSTIFKEILRDIIKQSQS